MSDKDCKTADSIVCDEELTSPHGELALARPECDSPEREQNIDAHALGRYKAGFTLQGVLWCTVWGLAWILPLLGTATWLPEMYGPNRALVLLPFLIFVAVPSSIMGAFAFFTGRAYVNRAQRLFADADADKVPCRMELKLRPKTKSMYGSTLCDAILTYADGRVETLKLLARGIELSPLLGDPIAKATLIGSPFSSMAPRVVATSYGELLEQPDISQVWTALFARRPSTGARRLRALDNEMYRLLFALASGGLIWPIWAWFLPHSVSNLIWWFIPTYIALGIYVLFRAKTAWDARKLASLREPLLCTVVSQPAHWGERIKNKVTMIVTGEGHERRETLCGYVPRKFDGKVLEASVWYKDGAPWMVATNDFVLFKTDFRRLALLPALLYFVALLFVIPNIYHMAGNTPASAHSASEFYENGIQYKAYGWTERARQSLTTAAKLDPDGPIGRKASIYLKSHIPAYPVVQEAEQQNIRAHYLSYRNGEQSKAIWNDLIERYPNFEWPYANLGQELVREGRATEAIPLLEKALTINPQYTNALHHMFVAQSLSNNRTAAIEYLRRCAQSDPDNSSLQAELFLVEHSF